MICPPSPIDDTLARIFRHMVKKYPSITRSDIIRWGIAALREYPELHYEPARPMRRKSPSFVISENDFSYLKDRREKYSIPVTQSIRDAIYAASLHH